MQMLQEIKHKLPLEVMLNSKETLNFRQNSRRHTTAAAIFEEQTIEEKTTERNNHIMMNMRQYIGSGTDAEEMVESI